MDYYSYTTMALGLLLSAGAGFAVAFVWARNRFVGWSRGASEAHRLELDELEFRYEEKISSVSRELEEMRANWTDALASIEAGEARAKAAEARTRGVTESSQGRIGILEKELELARADYTSLNDALEANRAGMAGVRAEYEIQIAGLKAEAAEWRAEAETLQVKAAEWQSKAAEWKAMSELAADLVPETVDASVPSADLEDYKRTIAMWENHVETLSAEYQERSNEAELRRTSMENELTALRANLSDRNEAISRLEADAALLSHMRQSMRERQTRIDGLELQVRQLREELAAIRSNLSERNETIARLEADAALLSHVRQSMRERQTRIDGLQLQLNAARAAGDPSSAVAEEEIRKLQARVKELEGAAAGENHLHNLQLRLRVASLRGIRFLPDSAELLPESLAAIDNAAIALSAVRGVRVEIAGHTDSIGEEGRNQRLSEQRAETVRSYLISRGVRPEMLTAAGYGGTRPIADNALDDGRYANRRIDFVVR